MDIRGFIRKHECTKDESVLLIEHLGSIRLARLAKQIRKAVRSVKISVPKQES